MQIRIHVLTLVVFVLAAALAVLPSPAWTLLFFLSRMHNHGEPIGSAHLHDLAPHPS
jgi:hypothetical protein